MEASRTLPWGGQSSVGWSSRPYQRFCLSPLFLACCTVLRARAEWLSSNQMEGLVTNMPQTETRDQIQMVTGRVSVRRKKQSGRRWVIAVLAVLAVMGVLAAELRSRVKAA